MKYNLDEMFMFRFYEKNEGPFSSIRNLTPTEIDMVGYNTGISNIREIYKNRVMIENLMRELFIKQGGDPHNLFPYYGAVFDVLPLSNRLHIRYSCPECIKIPLNKFRKDQVSFTYGKSPRAFTRKDNHPLRRRVLMWDQAEEAINSYPFNEDEEIWLEIQVWDKAVINDCYNAGTYTHAYQLSSDGRMDLQEVQSLSQQYSPLMSIIKSDLFESDKRNTMLLHSKRILILAQELAKLVGICERDRYILNYCAAYYDIDHADRQKSFHLMQELELFPRESNCEIRECVRFIILNCSSVAETMIEQLNTYSKIKNKRLAYQLCLVFHDVLILDHCRLGHVDKFALYNPEAKKLVHLAYQLLLIYKH